MLNSPKARYIARAIVAAALAGLSIAATIWVDNPYVKIASAVVGVFAVYLGIGAATPIEPNVGRKL